MVGRQNVSQRLRDAFKDEACLRSPVDFVSAYRINILHTNQSMIKVQSWDASTRGPTIKSAMRERIYRKKYDGVRILYLKDRLKAICGLVADIAIFHTINLLYRQHGSFSIPGADVHNKEIPPTFSELACNSLKVEHATYPTVEAYDLLRSCSFHKNRSQVTGVPATTEWLRRRPRTASNWLGGRPKPGRTIRMLSAVKVSPAAISAET